MLDRFFVGFSLSVEMMLPKTCMSFFDPPSVELVELSGPERLAKVNRAIIFSELEPDSEDAGLTMDI